MRQYKYRKDFTVNGKRYTVRADTKKELVVTHNFFVEIPMLFRRGAAPLPQKYF